VDSNRLDRSAFSEASAERMERLRPGNSKKLSTSRGTPRDDRSSIIRIDPTSARIYALALSNPRARNPDRTGHPVEPGHPVHSITPRC